MARGGLCVCTQPFQSLPEWHRISMLTTLAPHSAEMFVLRDHLKLTAECEVGKADLSYK